MPPVKVHATLGFRAHSGWAAYVALAGSPRAPIVVDRGRIEMTVHGDQEARQPYHAAEELPLSRAAKLLKRYSESAGRLAERGLGGVTESLRRRDFRVVGCGLICGSGRSGVPLSKILASHALIHTADGDHFRDALTFACEREGLAVTGIREREVFDRGQGLLSLPVEEVRKRLTELGRPLGPPWRLDEKYAALVAWIVLATPIDAAVRRR